MDEHADHHVSVFFLSLLNGLLMLSSVTEPFLAAFLSSLMFF